MTSLNFECSKCNNSFDIEAKNASFGKNGKLIIEEEIACPNCGNLKNGEYVFPEDFNKAAVGELYFGFMKKEKMKRCIDKIREKAISEYRPGDMFHYEEAFTREKWLTQTIDNKEYFMLSSYCIVPDCECTDIFLDFIDNTDERKIKTPAFSLKIDYETGDIGRIDNIDEEKAKDIIKNFTQETMNIFKEKHKKLKEELNDDVLEILKSYRREIPELPKRKIGRNELCPCGSGIKYKRCCLNKN